MASRKEQKEQLRAERVAAEAQQQSAERRRRMIQYGSASVLVAAVVVAVLIVVSQSGTDTPKSAGDVAGVAEVNAELGGITQDGTILGEQGPGVTVVEFGDLQCPVCQAFSSEVAPDIIGGPVSDGTAAYEFRQWAILGDDSITAAKAALAAADQGRYWQFIELFYRNQGTENSGYVTDDFLTSIADAAGVQDIEQWNSDRNSDKYNSVLEQTNSAAQGFGFAGTPSILVKGPAGQQVFDSVPTFDAIQEAISSVQ